jgi:hypothetical protein
MIELIMIIDQLISNFRGDCMVIDIKNRDIGGREGVLDIDGVKIRTPDYLPNQKDINNLKSSPFVNDRNFPNIDVGVYNHWLSAEKITLISGDIKKYNYTKRYLKSKLNIMANAGVKRKLLHFEFYSDVTTLSGQQLDTLLKLQNDVGADVIEIPNTFPIKEYKIILDRADKWRHSEGIEKDLMAIANEGYEIEMLKDKTNIISCVGTNLKNENTPPLLSAIKNYLKPEDIWVHAFSVPRSFRVVGWSGTLSVLLNYFGIDTISSMVIHPEGARNYRFRFEAMNEEQKIEESQDIKYFNPMDYSTLKLKYMSNNICLSKFCNCPVCQKNNIDTITKNIDTINANIHSHEVFAYKNEASNYQTSIIQNVSEEYLNSKKCAKEILSRLGF